MHQYFTITIITFTNDWPVGRKIHKLNFSLSLSQSCGQILVLLVRSPHSVRCSEIIMQVFVKFNLQKQILYLQKFDGCNNDLCLTRPSSSLSFPVCKWQRPFNFKYDCSAIRISGHLICYFLKSSIFFSSRFRCLEIRRPFRKAISFKCTYDMCGVVVLKYSFVIWNSIFPVIFIRTLKREWHAISCLMIIIHVSKKSPLRPSRRVTIPALFFDIIISQHFFLHFRSTTKE